MMDLPVKYVHVMLEKCLHILMHGLTFHFVHTRTLLIGANVKKSRVLLWYVHKFCFVS